METVHPNRERVKPLFDEVPLGVVDPTAQPGTSEGSPIAELIDEKHDLSEAVFLGQTVEEYGCWIGALMSEQLTSRTE